MLLADRASAVDTPINATLTPSVIFFRCASLGVFFSAPCQMSRVSTVDIVIRPQSMVDMTAAMTAATIRAQGSAGSSFRITTKKAWEPVAPYLKFPKEPMNAGIRASGIIMNADR